MSFNPRLKGIDIVIFVGILAICGPLMPMLIRAVAPAADYMALGIRAAVAIALGALWLRMKFLPAEFAETYDVSPTRRVTSMLVFAVGGTLSALACLGFVAMSAGIHSL